jgi:hypothetical protein
MHASPVLWGIGAFRAFGGAVFWIAPGPTARVYGARIGPGERLTARLAGVREVALAAGPLLSAKTDRRRWLQLGLACDLADAAATLIGQRRGDLSANTASLCFVTYGISAALTAAALRSVSQADGTSARPRLRFVGGIEGRARASSR